MGKALHQASCVLNELHHPTTEREDMRRVRTQKNSFFYHIGRLMFVYLIAPVEDRLDPVGEEAIREHAAKKKKKE